MDNMLEHPGIELQLLIKEKGLTQKAFASILGKKVSEVNELLKGKRNITIQRDYLLHQALGTPIKCWILKQIDYDYSLLDIEETQHHDVILNDSEESSKNGKFYNSSLTGENLGEVGNQIDYSNSLHSPLNDNKTQDETKHKKTPIKELNPKDDKDIQNRANIFRSF